MNDLFLYDERGNALLFLDIWKNIVGNAQLFLDIGKNIKVITNTFTVPNVWSQVALFLSVLKRLFQLKSNGQKSGEFTLSLLLFESKYM